VPNISVLFYREIPYSPASARLQFYTIAATYTRLLHQILRSTAKQRSVVYGISLNRNCTGNTYALLKNPMYICTLVSTKIHRPEIF